MEFSFKINKQSATFIRNIRIILYSDQLLERPKFHFNMDFKTIFSLLILVHTILARPQESESEDPKTLCASYFSGKKIPINEKLKIALKIDKAKERIWKENDLTYK